VAPQQVARRRQPWREQFGQKYLLLQDFDGARQTLAAAGKVLAEQRSAYDAQRELHHLFSEVEHGSCAQPVHQAVCFGGDQLCVALDALVPEPRLDAAALAPPLFAVTRE
jgi:hypothetical protein